MKKASESDSREPRNIATVVYFSSDERLTDRIKGDMPFTAGQEQHVLFVNEQHLVNKQVRDRAAVETFDMARPYTSVVGNI